MVVVVAIIVVVAIRQRVMVLMGKIRSSRARAIKVVAVQTVGAKSWRVD